MVRERWALGALLVATFAIRALHPHQPIVENYVGRQIPTAMVARNLERDRDLLRPKLDTGPLPNLFLVEPPIYAMAVVLLRPILATDLEATGRLISAAGATLGAWGLYGLARRREGASVALLAVASFGAFPVMVRYGRSFQPDALMIGFVLAGIRGWDEYEATGDRRWAAFGGFVLAIGLALKMTVAWALIPFFLIARRLPVAARIALAVAMVAPAMAWYFHAWREVTQSSIGSRASADNAAIWLRSASPSTWVRFSTWAPIGRALLVGSFTPVGFTLATLGSFFPRKVDRLWLGWAAGCGLSVLALAPKWHHGYYWMVAAPPAAVGVARALVAVSRSGKSGRWVAAGLGSFFLAGCAWQSASTFRTPAEWINLVEAGREVRANTPNDGSLVAPEALLYYSHRLGRRLEFDPAAARRAAGEWGGTLPAGDDPLALVEFHRDPDSWIYVADTGPADDHRRRAWRVAIRARPRSKVLIDKPDLLIVKLR